MHTVNITLYGDQQDRSCHPVVINFTVIFFVSKLTLSFSF